jgi:hypothetical protein
MENASKNGATSHIRRISSMILAVLILLSCVSCVDEKREPTTQESESSSVTDKETENPRYVCELPADLDYQGQTVTMVVAGGEGHTDEFVIGAGYTIKNLSFVTKNRDGAQKKVSNDLKLNVDISYKDIKTLLRKVEEGLTQASSGNKALGIKISADYVLSQKINLQFFYDHQGTTPLISSSYPIKADNVGINIKLMLTR